MNTTAYGFVGLGNMGGPMAANIAASGCDLTVYDSAGTAELAPPGSVVAESLAELAAKCDVVFLSLPDGSVSTEVVQALIAQPDRRVSAIVDLSTTGIVAAEAIDQACRDAGLVYADAPVSGGQAGARAGTVSLIWSGPKTLMEDHRPALEAMAGNLFHVGDRPGQGQAMKLLNNFLSATAMAATSEAVLFGLAQGLDMATMMAVLNVSTGRNTATSDKFPNRIQTGSFDAGFHTALMAKDVALYHKSTTAAGTAHSIGDAVAELWNAADKALPGSDFTRIFEFIRERESG